VIIFKFVSVVLLQLVVKVVLPEEQNS